MYKIILTFLVGSLLVVGCGSTKETNYDEKALAIFTSMDDESRELGCAAFKVMSRSDFRYMIASEMAEPTAEKLDAIYKVYKENC